MSEWRVAFSREAADETRGIPPEAFIALMTLLGDASHNPWEHSRAQHSNDPHRRVAMFANSGMVAFDLSEPDRLLRVHAVTWLG